MSVKPGDWGTLDSLNVNQQDRTIKVIKLDFDFEYNSICFSATTSGLTERMHVLDRNGTLNYGTNSQEAQWTKEERAQFLGIYQRSPYGTMAWSEVHNGVASDLRQHSGLWALKGDRVNGLNVRVGELATVRFVQGEFQDRLVWDVYLDNVKDSILRKVFK